ncbi:hypothetical protein IU459_13115 [Nocardia amamiensis]|uniref:DUF222 domain-containing protein n=1 Tax=Nocardia amamiensis TaxID=404578 RepID=A0ABS0CPE7_9NOCA|nr:hypothetical protein [Nocardia amamiensis]MBF6298479.1 hypothetical protein [Nocardia amamiensis]
MSINEPLHDPADLLDELDAIIREQELLRQRTVALQARYRALEAHADRYDKPGPYEWLPEEFGSVNVEAVVQRLDCAADSMYYPAKWFVSARECAAKVREYPQSDREQADAAGPASAGSGSALAEYRPGRALADRGEIDGGRSL